MTPKEKAKELYDKFEDLNDDGYSGFEQACAIICVDEIQKNGRHFITKIQAELYGLNQVQSEEYWQEVKTEIEKI